MGATADDASTTARANTLQVRMRTKPTIHASSCKRHANTNVLGISPGARSLTCSVGRNSGTGRKESSRWSQGKTPIETMESKGDSLISYPWQSHCRGFVPHTNRHVSCERLEATQALPNRLGVAEHGVDPRGLSHWQLCTVEPDRGFRLASALLRQLANDPGPS